LRGYKCIVSTTCSTMRILQTRYALLGVVAHLSRCRRDVLLCFRFRSALLTRRRVRMSYLPPLLCSCMTFSPSNSYALVSCSNHGPNCPRLRRGRREEHEATCPHRPVVCSACNLPFPSSHMEVPKPCDLLPNPFQSHTQRCPEVLLSCERCGQERLRRGALPEHWAHACNESAVPCAFESEGCPWKASEQQEAIAHWSRDCGGMWRRTKRRLPVLMSGSYRQRNDCSCSTCGSSMTR
jgi:hypothetical protein